MGREEPGDSHPIINQWGGAWVVPGPGEGGPRVSMVNLKCVFSFKSQTLPNFSLPQNTVAL
jgi:hypothetical protein